APEAAYGKPLDARADVFALGIITWEMLTGRRLFYGDDPHQTIQLVRAARIPSIPALNPKVTPELDAIVRKALARAPAQRTATAADFADELAQHLFDRSLKVTARNVWDTVRAMRAAKKPSSAAQSLINALIADEVARM